MNMKFLVIMNQGFKQTHVETFYNHEDAYSCFCDLLMTLPSNLTIRMEMQRT